MLIVSDFHDYYDTAIGYGIDKTCVYKRKSEEIEDYDELWPTIRGHRVDGSESGKASYWMRRIVIGFCGEMFPGVQVHVDDHSKSHKTYDLFFYDAEKYTEFLKEHDFFQDDKRYYHPGDIRKNKGIEDHFNPNNWSHLKGLFIEHKCPVILIVPKKRGYLKNDNRKPGVLLNPQLKGYGFVVVKDPYTAGHQQRVAQLAVAIAREMGFDADRVEGIRLGGIIHDVGKIYVPAEILNRPGKLTAPEFEIIKSHPEVGYEIIKGVQFPWPVAQMVYQHHERLDGSGYPRQLKDAEIALEAKILAVADVVEAISSHRPYRAALGVEAGLEEIRRKRGVWYDADAVDACLKLFADGRFAWSD